jgi:hypothetical protein
MLQKYHMSRDSTHATVHLLKLQVANSAGKITDKETGDLFPGITGESQKPNPLVPKRVGAKGVERIPATAGAILAEQCSPL